MCACVWCLGVGLGLGSGFLLGLGLGGGLLLTPHQQYQLSIASCACYALGALLVRVAVAALAFQLVELRSPAVLAVLCQMVLDGVEGDSYLLVAVGAASLGISA